MSAAQLSQALEAREASLKAFEYDRRQEPERAADLLAIAAESAAACTNDYDKGSTPTKWRAYGAALKALEQLTRWDAAVRTAEVDAERYLRAAHRTAELALDAHAGDSHGRRSLPRTAGPVRERRRTAAFAAVHPRLDAEERACRRPSELCRLARALTSRADRSGIPFARRRADHQRRPSRAERLGGSTG
jgi:hypothetical protein